MNTMDVQNACSADISAVGFKGELKNFTACIDKAGYKDILSKAGYWTIFAPNDDAFVSYLQENNLSNIGQLPDSTATKIVKYALIYNSFKSDRLADYQSSIGWVPNNSFKRRTTYYAGLDTGVIAGKPVFITSSNRNNLGGNYYVSADNNNKYIPYFTDKYLNAKGLSANDYTYFFPESTFSGFNVSAAKVVNKDIVAENGFIHETDKVILPLPNIDQYLSKSSQYSDFKAMLDKYMVSYIVNPSATAKNKEITGSNTDVYVKVFNSSLVVLSQ